MMEPESSIATACRRAHAVTEPVDTRPAGAFELPTGRYWEGTAFGEGSAFGGKLGRCDVPRIVDGYMDGKITIDDLITHTMPLEDINNGFDLMQRGESIRGVVLY